MNIGLLVLLLLILTLIAGFTLTNGIGPTPSCRNTSRALDKFLPETISGTILELGCGWGGIALYLAKKYPDNRVTAWENSPVPWLVACTRKMLSGQYNLEIRYGDIGSAPIDDCGLIFCYLCTGQMLRLKERFAVTPVCDYCYLVSSTFSVPGWKPLHEYRLGDWYGSSIFVYAPSHQSSSLKALSRLFSK
ncbi:MAG: methyltransferase [Endozoicomonadaceae bacterium]|nr:methyltransferase [Endozoicomonadaceae bacterium]